MAKVKIIWFTDGGSTEATERQLEALIDEGYRIVAAGGGGDAPESVEGKQMMYRPFGMGFVIVQKDDDKRATGTLRQRVLDAEARRDDEV